MGILKKIEAAQEKPAKKQYPFLLSAKLVDEYADLKKIARAKGYKFNITANVENVLRASIAAAKKELGI